MLSLPRYILKEERKKPKKKEKRKPLQKGGGDWDARFLQ